MCTSDWLKKCAITASKEFNLEINAHFPIQETVYKINKYMIGIQILALITNHAKCFTTES